MMTDPIESICGDATKRAQALIKRLFVEFMLSLVRPLATVTEVLWHRDLGERYFTRFNYIAGALMIPLSLCVPSYMADAPTTVARSVGASSYTANSPPVPLPLVRLPVVVHVVGGAVLLVVFLGAGWSQFRGVKARYRTGEIWHSYSSGTPVPLQAEITGAIGVALILVGNFGLGGLVFMSAFVSSRLRLHEAKAFRDKVLDALDAEIEMKNLNDAVLHRKSPAETEGFRAPLPAHASDAFRRRLMDVVGGGGGGRSRMRPGAQTAAPEAPLGGVLTGPDASRAAAVTVSA